MITSNLLLMTSFPLYYTLQWAAVFHDREFAAEDIPFNFKLLREEIDQRPPSK
jgi:hypothetical protein